MEGLIKMTPEVNKELRDLTTHVTAATDLHETRTTDRVVQIDPPLDPTHGPNDMRDKERYSVKYDTDTNTNEES
jgi:hypothetical protein